LDVWSLPFGARIVPFVDPSSNTTKFLRLWIPENEDGVVFVELELQVRSPYKVLVALNEEVSSRGYQFRGDYDSLKTLAPRQNNGSGWKIENSRMAVNGNYVFTLSISEEYLPIFGKMVTSAPGFNVLFDWEIEGDPVLDSSTFGPIATSFFVENADSFEKIAYRPPLGSSTRDFVFVNREDHIDGKRIVMAEVSLEVLGSDGDILQSGIVFELGRQGLPSARKNIKLLVPPGFQIAYSVIWHLEGGSELMGREMLGTGYRHYVEWEG
jgi:hypothetical protein